MQNPLLQQIQDEILQAETRIHTHILETPLIHSPYLSGLSNANVYLKLESQQITGSFKLRGAANKMLSLSEDEKKRGVVTASSGNHGAASAYLLKRLGIPGTIYLPETVSPAKVQSLKLYNPTLVFHGNDCVLAEQEARRVARKTGCVFISPYNDPKVIGGQGTVGVEIGRRLEKVDAVFIPVGGGGLASGVAVHLKSRFPEIKVIGCQPVKSAVMAESVKSGRILDLESLPTLADGTAGGIESGAVTFDICRQVIDEFFLLTETEIADAIRLAVEKQHQLIEGAAALSVAAFIQKKMNFHGMTVVLIISGGKISIDALKTILRNS